MLQYATTTPATLFFERIVQTVNTVENLNYLSDHVGKSLAFYVCVIYCHVCVGASNL